ncbi:hypothetical protein F2P81_012221 [Scophthalmus maximus]|uniref:Uncharacterized protein n=1 Tax=Scophthalmus maximus TaxID=52904 RepID=A0A6A4SK05_SCOMX|nr:hypothetical protein F2P81_012221 [Scophthalmus maximus]
MTQLSAAALGAVMRRGAQSDDGDTCRRSFRLPEIWLDQSRHREDSQCQDQSCGADETDHYDSRPLFSPNTPDFPLTPKLTALHIDPLLNGGQTMAG